MDDRDVTEQISDLVAEERELRNKKGPPTDEERERIHELEVRLDQCWDLLRRRQAREEFGDNPDVEQVRPSSVVENYLQ